MDHPTLLILVKVTIFSLMLAIGVNLPFKQLLSFWRHPGLLLRSLLAVVVLVPLIVMILLWSFDLPAAIATGLALLAVAPGAPLTTKRSQMAAGHFAYSADLQLTLALLAILLTPLTLAIFVALFELQAERVTALEVARQVALVQFLPVGIGLLFQRFAPKLTKVIGSPLSIIANGLFFVLIALALIPGVRMTLQLGVSHVLAIVIMVAVSLAVGHLLGGPGTDRRSALAIASIARNIGLALFIATLNGVQKEIIPTLLSYMILGAIVAIPYSAWCKRRAAPAV